MGFWVTAGGVALGSGLGAFGQWLADRRADHRERRADNRRFKVDTIQNTQDALKELWRQHQTSGRVAVGRAPEALTQAVVNASAWRSRLDDRGLAHEIKEWMDDVAQSLAGTLPVADEAAMPVTYRAFMATLGAKLQDLHKD